MRQTLRLDGSKKYLGSHRMHSSPLNCLYRQSSMTLCKGEASRELLRISTSISWSHLTVTTQGQHLLPITTVIKTPHLMWRPTPNKARLFTVLSKLRVAWSC
ncbi:hypothetical protein LB503_010937 [Fusarium chuoi]|nr:hypothetical protein LB503_010937 [Fusarium chuoi]